MVVADVPVALAKVKFWRVEDPVSKRLERVESPAVAVRVPVKLAALEMVCELMRPEVIAPVVKAVEKRFVLLAVVLKKFVVVALVPVAFAKVKFCKVLEALRSRLAKVPKPVEVKLPPEPVVKKRLVELAVVLKKLVVVALVEVELRKVRF